MHLPVADRSTTLPTRSPPPRPPWERISIDASREPRKTHPANDSPARKASYFSQGNHSLDVSSAVPATHQLKYVPTVGVEAGFWWGELLSDPRPVDAFSLVYDSAPLQDEVAVLGRPHARLQASASD